MEKQILNEVIEETKKLIAAPSCSQEAKDAANAWLDAVGTDNEEAETKKYIAELRRRYHANRRIDRICRI